MSREDPQKRTDRDPTGTRERRLTALRDQVTHSAYDVPAEDVAASIIHGALLVVAPAPALRH